MKKILFIVFLVLLMPVMLLAGDQEVVNYINNYHNIGSNIKMYLSFAAMDYEVKGLGYTIKDNGKNCLVIYHFTLDGKDEYARWRYGKGSGIVEPLNEWARVFMGK